MEIRLRILADFRMATRVRMLIAHVVQGHVICPRMERRHGGIMLEVLRNGNSFFEKQPAMVLRSPRSELVLAGDGASTFN